MQLLEISHLIILVNSDWFGLLWLLAAAALIAFGLKFASGKYLFNGNKPIFWFGATAVLGLLVSAITGILNFGFKTVLGAFALGVVIHLFIDNLLNKKVDESQYQNPLRQPQMKYMLGLAIFIVAAVIAGKIFFKRLNIA